MNSVVRMTILLKPHVVGVHMNSDQNKLVLVDILCLPLTIMPWRMLFPEKYGPMIPPAQNLYQTLTFSEYDD